MRTEKEIKEAIEKTEALIERLKSNYFASANKLDVRLFEGNVIALKWVLEQSDKAE